MKNQSFMREKVVKRGNLKRRLLWAVRMVLGGILFGLAACLVFVCLKPWILPQIVEEPETTEEAIVLPGETETTQAPETTEEETPTDEITLPTEEAPILSIEEQIALALESHSLTMEDYRRLDQLLAAFISECNRGVVTLAAATLDGNGGFTSGEQEAAGVLWMMTEKDGLILTDCSRLAEAKHFFVKCMNGNVLEGTLKAADYRTGVAVVEVSRSDLEAAGIFASDVLELGLSHNNVGGQSVIMLGSPYGVPYSVMSGQVVHVENEISDADTEYKMMYSDIPAIGGGFLVNMSGQVLGMTVSSTAKSAEDGFSKFIAISDLRDTIENLANGRRIAYIGVLGDAVTQDRSEETGIPVGLYVSEVLEGGPAYLSGIQSGDVIVAMNDTAIVSMKDLQAALHRIKPDQIIKIQVMRQGKDAYAQQTYELMAGAR